MCRRLLCESSLFSCCVLWPLFFFVFFVRVAVGAVTAFFFSRFSAVDCASPFILPFLYPILPPSRHIASTRRHFLFIPNPSTYTSLVLLRYGTHSFRFETPPLSSLRHPSCVHAEARAPFRILFFVLVLALSLFVPHWPSWIVSPAVLVLRPSLVFPSFHLTTSLPSYATSSHISQYNPPLRPILPTFPVLLVSFLRFRLHFVLAFFIRAYILESAAR